MALYMTILYRRQIEHIVWILKKIPYYFVMLRIFELFSTFLLVRFCKKNKNLDFFFFFCVYAISGELSLSENIDFTAIGGLLKSECIYQCLFNFSSIFFFE